MYFPVESGSAVRLLPLIGSPVMVRMPLVKVIEERRRRNSSDSRTGRTQRVNAIELHFPETSGRLMSAADSTCRLTMNFFHFFQKCYNFVCPKARRESGGADLMATK